MHPGSASLGMLRHRGGGALRGEAALCGFTVHLCPLNPHENVEVVKCHQLGRGEGGRTRKAPTKGGHCLGRGSGGSAGEPAECPSPPAPTAQVPMKRQLYPPEPFVGGDADPQHPGPWSKPAPREAGGAGGEHRVPQPPEPASGCQGCSPPSSLPFPLPGKPDLRGQTGRSHSGSRSSPASPPIFSISRPFMAIASGRALGPCQAGGRDTSRVTWGCPEGGSPSAILGTRSFCRTAAFVGALHPVHFQVYFVPAAVH